MHFCRLKAEKMQDLFDNQPGYRTSPIYCFSWRKLSLWTEFRKTESGHLDWFLVSFNKSALFFDGRKCLNNAFRGKLFYIIMPGDCCLHVSRRLPVDIVLFSMAYKYHSHLG